jgi:serine/threonine protein kinase/WD40 repeat protein
MQTYQIIDWQGRQFQQYHIHRLLKRDRIGALWLAEDRQQQRLVVLRLLPGVATNAHAYLHLFEQTALASSGLEHPHILPVYDSGVQTGNQDEVIPYLVYPYLEQATTLHAHLQRSGGTLPAPEALRYLSQAAQAIDYAHSQLVIHGALQPACLLLDGSRLLVSDFGLTLLLNSDITVSRTFSIDLPYLAPEQVQGRTEATSDCYSLAVIAYQLCVGRLPFEGQGNPYNLLLQQLTMAPLAPGSFNPTLSPQMETVLLKALSRQPSQRYADCSEMVDTLNRARRGLPLDPRDDPEATINASRSKRFLTQPDLSSLPTPTPQPPSEQSTQSSAPFQPDSTAAMRSTLPSPQPSAPLASLSIQQSVPPASPVPPAPLPAIPAASPVTGKKTLPPMRITPESPPVAPTECTDGPSPLEGMLKGRLNRRTVLIGGASAAALAAGGIAILTLWPTKLPPGPQHFTPGNPILHLTGHSDVVYDVAWDSSGRYLASGSTDTRVMLWDIGGILQRKSTMLQVMSHPTRQWKFPHSIEFNSLSWTSSGHKLIVSNSLNAALNYSSLGSFTLFDSLSNSDTQQTYTNTSTYTSTGLQDPILFDAQSGPRSDLLAAIDGSQKLLLVQLWHQNQPATAIASLSQTALTPGDGNTETLAVIGWSCDGTMIAGLTSFLNLVIWDVKTHSVKKTIKLPYRQQKVNNPDVKASLLRWSPLDPHILAVAVIETIVVVDISSGKILDILSTDNESAYTSPDTPDFPNWVPQVFSFDWSPNGRYIVAGYSQAFSTMAFWDLQQKNVRRDQQGGHVQDYLFPSSDATNAHAGSIFAISWSPDGRYLATGSVDKTILVWQVDADEQ